LNQNCFSNILDFRAKGLNLQSKFWNIKILRYEKNISTIQTQEDKQARFPRENVNRQRTPRPEDATPPWPQKADCFF
jgi:hypothetical protein